MQDNVHSRFEEHRTTICWAEKPHPPTMPSARIGTKKGTVEFTSAERSPTKWANGAGGLTPVVWGCLSLDYGVSGGLWRNE